MRRARLFLVLIGVTLLPQLLAAARLMGWLGAHHFGVAKFSLPVALAFLNLPLLAEISRRRKATFLPRAIASTVYQLFTAWWLGSILYALLLAIAFPVIALRTALGAAPSDLPIWLQLAPFALAAYGALVGSSVLRHDRVKIPIALLPDELKSLRIVQLSDLHSGRHVSEARLMRIARRAAKLKPDLVVVTGDIVHNSAAFAAQAGRALASIPSRLGVYACLGNHDFWAGADEVAAELTRAGVHMLRNRGLIISPNLWLCGVDDPWGGKLDLPAALEGKPKGAVTLLLCHQPNSWKLAREHGVELQLSGHTHGGQIAATWLHRSLSLARLITPFVAGFYQQGPNILYVNRGAGSVVPMIRLGARPEVTELSFIDSRDVRAAQDPKKVVAKKHPSDSDDGLTARERAEKLATT
jgi:predicted MPP superfamily phosphohydrolase